VGLKFDGTHKLLNHVDDVNPLEGNSYTMKTNPESLLDTRKENGLEVNAYIYIYIYIYINWTSFSPGSLQPIMPYQMLLRLQRQLIIRALTAN
jgi:hypothetical protein